LPARRCGTCGISYPNIAQFSTCPIHGESTTYASNIEPDEDWQANFERLSKQASTDAEKFDRVFPLIRGVPVIEEDGRYFVDQTALQLEGVRFSRMMPDQFYLFELDDGWIYETQGFDEPRRRWWVERVVRAVERVPAFYFLSDSSPGEDWEWSG
jgi:hypothetical protein